MKLNTVRAQTKPKVFNIQNSEGGPTGLAFQDSEFPRWRKAISLGFLLVLACAITTVIFLNVDLNVESGSKFHFNITSPQGLCEGVHGPAISHAGFIGLKGDTEEKPKRSFFWYFEAEKDPQDSPLILAVSGGPGTSAMSHTLFAQAPCVITPNGIKPNPNAWAQQYNVLALDHPIGVGYSYGTMVNNSRAAAEDVYDFLQKFFILFPHLAKNKFVVAGGSYGGVYLPHIATVIQEQNRLISGTRKTRNRVLINLDSLMLSNSFMDPESYFIWQTHYGCYTTDLFNSTQCLEMHSKFPYCIEGIRRAYDSPRSEDKAAAWKSCMETVTNADYHGRSSENIDQKCDGSVEDCHPVFGWISDFFDSQITREQLHIPDHLKFISLNMEVNRIFTEAGDHVQKAYRLYEPLITNGIRVLHYVGDRDANCPWPGVLSTIKLQRTPYQDEFNRAVDTEWKNSGLNGTTVRAAGDGAGSLTYIQIPGAGHFTAYDNPVIVRKIIEYWIDNRPFV